MSTVIAAITLLALVVAALRYPPLALFAYSFATPGGEGFGVSAYLRSTGYELYATSAAGPFLLAAVVAYAKIMVDVRVGRAPRRMQAAASIAVVSMAWLCLAFLSKDGDIVKLPNTVAYTGIPAFIIVLAYWHDELARRLLVICIAAQLLISLLVIMFPNSPFGELSGTLYDPMGWGSSFMQTNWTGAIARIDTEERYFAQHNNPLTYGFFGIVGIILGLRLIFTSGKGVQRWLGITLVGLGAVSWAATLGRGTTLGVLAGAMVIFFGPQLRTAVPGPIRAAIAAVMALGLIASTFFIRWDELQSVFLVSEDDPSVTGRASALRLGAEIIMDRPFMGAPLGMRWPDNVAPHQMIVFGSATYGIPMGLGILALTLMSLRAAFVPSKLPVRDLVTCVLLGGACLGTALTNPASPLLYHIALAIACVPWIVFGREPVAEVARDVPSREVDQDMPPAFAVLTGASFMDRLSQSAPPSEGEIQ